MTTPHNQPVRKVASSAIAGAIVVIIVWLLNTYLLAAPLPAEIVAALTTLISFAVGYLVPPSRKDMVGNEDDP